MINFSFSPITMTLLAFSISGCGTISSTSSDTLNFEANSSRGLTYFLPMKLVNLTVSGEKLNEKKAKTALDKAQATLKKANESAKKFKSDLDRKTQQLGAITTGSELHEKVSGEIASIAYDLAIAKKAQTAAALAVANETVKLNAAKENPGACHYKVAHSLSESLPDTGRKFTANPRHNVLRDDTQKLTISTSGLLSTANVVADDKTDEILAEFAGALSLRSSGGSSTSFLTTNETESESPPPKKRFCPIIPIKYVYNPVDPSDVSEVNQGLQKLDIPVKIGITKYLPGTNASNNYPANSTSINKSPNLLEALYYRTPVPVILSYEVEVLGKEGSKKWLPVSTSIANLPQAGPVSYIPMRSSAFVKSVDDVTFENGVVTTWNNESPSEALELVRLPVKILSSIVAIPAELLSLKVNYSNETANLAQSQGLAIAQQIRSQTLQTCLDKAGEDADLLLGCLPVESATTE